MLGASLVVPFPFGVSAAFGGPQVRHVLALIGCAAMFGCGGGNENEPPKAPVAPAAKGSVPDPQTPPPTALDSATKPAAAPADGPWPFGPAPSAEERTAQIERVKSQGEPLKSNWSPPGRGERYGHAEGLIAVAPDALRAKLVDFGHYKDLAGPKFRSVKVVDKQGDGTDVYFQLPIMKGIVVIWYITRFMPAKNSAAGTVVEGTFVKGNIKSMHIAFTVRPAADDKSSVMMCDLVLQPSVPAPQSALDEELRDACGDAINSVRRTLGVGG